MIALEGHLHVWIHFVTSNQITILLWRSVISQKNGILRPSKLRSNAVATLKKTFVRFFDPVVPFHAMKEYTTSRDIAPLILDLGIRWSCVANFKRRPLYRPESSTVFIAQKPIWTPEPVWMVLEKRKSLVLAGIRTPDRPARSESSFRLRFPSSQFPFQTHLKYLKLNQPTRCSNISSLLLVV